MKTLATLGLAAAFAVGLAASANAWQEPSYAYQDELRAPYASVTGEWYEGHNCVGLTSGTAHHSCGTLTGGPAGGLN